MRKIVYFSGTRAEYGIMRSTLQQIEADSRFNLQVIATGMHVMEEFGRTIEIIKKDGFSVTELPVRFENDTDAARSLFMGNLIVKLTSALEKLQPDFLLLLGDRVETLAAAAAATYLSIPIAHVHGGDISCTKDNQARHAITKLAHLHFAASEQSAKRIRLLGEEKWRIFNTGSPSVAEIGAKARFSKKEVFNRYGFSNDKPLLVILQHPNEEKNAREEIATTLRAVNNFAAQILIIYPNADPGGRAIIEEIEKERKKENVRIEKNVDYGFYLSILKHADVLIGNSSSGLIEAPSFGLPVVNIGDRENGRERAANVIDVPTVQDEIADAIRKALSEEFKERIKNCTNPYEKVGTAKEIISKLADVTIDENLLKKRLVFENGN